MEPVVIDGTMPQPDFAGAPVIVLDGVFAGSTAGLILLGGDSTIRGLAIIRFSGNGIELKSQGNTVEGNYIGIGSDGTTAFGNGGDGIAIFESNNTIGGTTAAARNVISWHLDGRGILIETTPQSGSLVINNVVQGNYIGTDADGTSLRGNKFAGVMILNSADNLIGGTTHGAANLIAGSSGSLNSHGVYIVSNDGTTSGNIVQGNLIGSDITGRQPGFGNEDDGVRIQDAFDNLIGGTEDGAGNLISGNSRGVVISAGASTGNVVQGNYIGTDSTGTFALGNSAVGVLIIDASRNSVGGADPGARNIISGNGGQGVRISLLAPGVADSNLVQGNYIGTDVTGVTGLGNGDAGILLAGVANTIIEDNVISDNIGGVVLDGTLFTDQATGNTKIRGNFIGTDASGSNAIPNRDDGISILQSSSNYIGGTEESERNIISGNGRHGIRISSAGKFSTDNIIKGNYIGLDATGTKLLANAEEGIFTVDGGASGTIIGGTEIGAGNVISGQEHNVVLSSDNNRVRGNMIGTDASGGSILGSGPLGVWIINGSNNEIGGFELGAGNLIAGQGETGVRIFGDSFSNLIARNVITSNGINGIKITENGTGNAIRENSVYSNGGIGIALGLDGVTPNDQNDIDIGPNNLQNYPVLTVANIDGGGIAIEGSLFSTADSQFIIEFFSNSECDLSGFGEGEAFIGADTVVTDASGDVFFQVHFAGVNIDTGYVTATATDISGNSSEFCSCVDVKAVSPMAPNLIAPPDGATIGSSSVSLVWFPSSGAAAYHIQLATDASFTTLVREDSTLTDTTLAIESLEQGTTYYWRLRAGNTVGWGAYSETRSFDVGAAPAAPALITPINGELNTSSTLTFVWATSPQVNAYHLQLSTEEDFSALVLDDSTLSDTTNQVGSLAELTKHFWRVRAMNFFGWGPYFEVYSFEVGITTGVESASVETPKAFTLAQNFPNPFNPRTTIMYELPSDSKVVIRIYNVLGNETRTLLESHKVAGRYSAIWDGTDNSGRKVPTGVYYYTMRAESNQNGTFIATRKVIVLK